MYLFESIPKYHADLTAGTITCENAVQKYILAIQQNQHLNCFVEVFAGEAIERATTLDKSRRAGIAPGKLHGVVIAIKDVICFANHSVSASSSILKGFNSLYSATAVERLLAEGAIIIGRLNCDEFAMGSSNENSSNGPVLNAKDNSRVPGGSSGGSAVAVQAALCMLSLGSDTGGSVRQPADFCGIVGYKPSYGRISRYGLIAYASSFDQIGIFANNVGDLSLALQVMAGPDEFDSTAIQDQPEDYGAVGIATEKKFRFAYFPDSLNHPGLDPEIRKAHLTFYEALEKAGHKVEAVDFEYLDFIVPAYYVLTTAEASSNLSRFDGIKYGYRVNDPSLELTEFYSRTRSEGFGKEVKRRIMLGTFVLSAGYFEAYYGKAQKVRRCLVNTTEAVFGQYDAILMPTSPSIAFKFGEKTNDPIQMFLADIYTVFANLTGIPGISLPFFTHSTGMPFGLQIMTSRGNDLNLLRISHQLFSQFRGNIR